MSSRPTAILRQVCALLLLVVVAHSHNAFAGTQVVNPAQLHEAAMTASQSRSADLASVKQFLQSELGQQAVRVAKADYARIERGVSTLDDQELARLAKQSQRLQADFAAGRLTSTHITYIIIATVAIVLIIALAAG